MTKDCRFLTCVLSSKAKGAAMSTILVTGGSGFIGSHCILQLLAAGCDYVLHVALGLSA
jgi:NAD(P)-dependent dehydrogenase (short-subunit alcohol dehydrogenase family)